MSQVLNVKNLTQRFGGLVALEHVDMCVNEGEIVGIIGPNGAGKSTLFNCITGIYNPTEGRVEMLGKDITGWKPYKVTELGFARTFQNIRLFRRMTVLDNVLIGMHTRTKTNLLTAIFNTRAKRKEMEECEKKAVDLLRLTQRFGGLVALEHVDMCVNEGEIVGIIGPNGAGKSTLFNCITGIYNPTEGRVEMLGKDITGWKPYKVTELGFARTFQNIRLFRRMTVLDNVLIGMHTRTKTNLLTAIFNTRAKRKEMEECEKKAVDLLRLFELQDLRYEMATSLPYGSQRDLEIARALASNPRLLLLDEPAAGMNESETETLRLTIGELKRQGYTVLLIEHDMKFVMNICERIYVLDNGRLIGSGTPSEVKANPAVVEAYLGKE